MTDDDLSCEGAVFALFANNQDRLPHFRALVPVNELTDRHGKRMGSNLKLAIVASVTANLKLAVVHLFLAFRFVGLHQVMS